MRKLLLSAALAFVAAIGGVAIAGAPAADPVVGIWKLNVSKSSFIAGPALKTQTRAYSQAGPSITLVMKSVVPL